jgi:hypothetical protein
MGTREVHGSGVGLAVTLRGNGPDSDIDESRGTFVTWSCVRPVTNVWGHGTENAVSSTSGVGAH